MKNQQINTLAPRRMTASALHGFSESQPVLRKLAKGIGGNYLTRASVTRKFLFTGFQPWNLEPETYISAMPNETVLQLDLPGIKKIKSGKVREIFDLGDRLLLVASDRISAFDVIMPN